MNLLDSETLSLLWHDADTREICLREIIGERLAENPPPFLHSRQPGEGAGG